MIFLIIISALCALLVSPTPSWAYIDPNTAGFVSQILAPLATLFVSCLIYFRRKLGAALSAGWRRLRGRLPDSNVDEEAC